MDIEHEFQREMEVLYGAAATLGYRPAYFLQMVQELGGVAAAKRLLEASDAQSGLIKLWELGRLDVSMEALVVQDRWKRLFSEAERQTARDRLEAFGYDPSTGS